MCIRDSCNRALMGSNMQRQAVPLMVTQQPIVATGMEYKAATDSGVCILAAREGTVEFVDAEKIVVRCPDGSADTYELIKFMRSNQGNCNNQRLSLIHILGGLFIVQLLVHGFLHGEAVLLANQAVGIVDSLADDDLVLAVLPLGAENTGQFRCV